MNKKAFLLLSISFLLVYSSFAQKQDKESKIKYDVHGFIKTDFWFDSRKTADSREGLFSLFPLDNNYDKNGNDINAKSEFNFSAATSRINLKISGFEAFGAKSYAFIEGGFSGNSTPATNLLRLRHAYLKMNWVKSSLLIGQYWHPMFVPEVFPSVAVLNTGAPFQPFLKNVQVQYNYNYKKFKIIAAALSHRDFVNIGPIGRSPKYLADNIIPNIHLQLQYKKGKNTIGIAGDYKAIRPETISDSNFINTNKVIGTSFMAYHKWANKKWTIKTKAVYAENLSDHLLLGGYAIKSIDESTAIKEYTPTKNIFYWSNINYTKNFKKFSLIPGIFIGYAKNLGTKEENIGTPSAYYALGANIDELYRFSSNLTFKSNNLLLTFEWEKTTAFYGKNTSMGKVVDTHCVANNRYILRVLYLF